MEIHRATLTALAPSDWEAAEARSRRETPRRGSRVCHRLDVWTETGRYSPLRSHLHLCQTGTPLATHRGYTRREPSYRNVTRGQRLLWAAR